ncbi:MAG: RNA polymerase sigma-70 factor (ECF subfamily) [Phycisphaerales bacterium]
MQRAEEHLLIRQAADGDRTAAGALVRNYQQSVYSYLLRMSGKPDIAEDIAQEAFVRVLTNLHRFDYRYRFSTWLFTIARRLYMNAMAKHRPAYDSEIVGSWKGDAGTPQAATLERETGEAHRDGLQAALNQLSMEQREIIILFHQQDWPIALIADHLEMPEGTVKSHLHRGRKRLRQIITTQANLSEMLVEEFA